jgi:hypothetical protein
MARAHFAVTFKNGSETQNVYWTNLHGPADKNDKTLMKEIAQVLTKRKGGAWKADSSTFRSVRFAEVSRDKSFMNVESSRLGQAMQEG